MTGCYFCLFGWVWLGWVGFGLVLVWFSLSGWFGWWFDWFPLCVDLLICLFVCFFFQHDGVQFLFVWLGWVGFSLVLVWFGLSGWLVGWLMRWFDRWTRCAQSIRSPWHSSCGKCEPRFFGREAGPAGARVSGCPEPCALKRALGAPKGHSVPWLFGFLAFLVFGSWICVFFATKS